MEKVRQRLKELFYEESAQGMAEYVLLLVAIIGIGILFKDQITNIITSKLDDIQGEFSGFNP